MKRPHPFEGPLEDRATAGTRRDFFKAAAGAAAAFSLSGASLSAAPRIGTDTRKEAGFSPVGELSARIRLTQDRLLRNGVPSFTNRFILADVELDPAYPRRFSNYSGDLSGRYIGALALLPPLEASARLDGLVRDLLTCQRADGRFGDAGLSFAPQDIGREQMALLWGNGRLLVGLLEYHSCHPGEETLGAAKKLAEFLLNVRANCSRPEVMKRLVGQRASGFICFTQLIEAFAMLGQRTGERRYYEAAAEIIPWLQPRGNQHSHGYLTTLRGIAQLYQATGNADQLRYVEGAYRELVSSSDYTIYGGVNEYFGAGQGDDRLEERSRDEGCSEADFLRLSLQLWRATGKIDYLERAERCILNEFFFNQFNTGDFGHHTSYRYGYRATESVGRAWWCCTMHGLRAFRDIADAVVTAKGDRVAVNLFLQGTWSDNSLSLDLQEAEPANPGGPMRFRVLVREAPAVEITIALRQPVWASRCIFRFNGGQVADRHKYDYHAMTRKWKKGDVLELDMDYGLNLLTRAGRSFAVPEAGAEPTEAVLFCGPYMLAADSVSEPAFFGEPWMGNNPTDSSVIVLPALAEKAQPQKGVPKDLVRPGAHRSFDYVHGGWPDKHRVTLHPISEQTARDAQALAVWLRWKAG